MNHFRILISFIVLIIIIPSSFGQKRTLKKADEAFGIGEYHIAFELYEKSYEKLPSKDVKAEVAFKLGECSRIMLNAKTAKKWYKRAVRYNVKNPMAYLYYADALKMGEEYAEAKGIYKKYQNLMPNDTRGKNGVESCDFALEWIQNPTRYVVLEAKDINSKRLRNKEPDKANLAGEFADVFLQLAMLAEMHSIDLGEAVEDKIKALKERGYLEKE